MFIFIRLLLAHFIGDFPLQSDSIFRLKLKGFWGIIPHAFIIVVCCCALCWPYLHLPAVWSFILFIGVTHLVQDSIKLNYGALKYSFWTYLLDQAFHIGIISLVLFTGISDLPPPSDQTNILVKLYANDRLVVYLILLIFVTYNGFYMIKNFYITFLGRASHHTVFEKWYGMFERAAILSLFLGRGQYIYLTPLVMILRPLAFLLWNTALRIDKAFTGVTEMALSWGIAVIGGMALLLF